MKELSIEEKAKAYDEAIEKLRDFYRDYDTVSRLIDVKEELANLFPELCESEDEKVRKALIRVLNENVGNGIEKYGAKLEEALEWLEKQGQKEATMNEIFFELKESEEPFIDEFRNYIHDFTRSVGGNVTIRDNISRETIKKALHRYRAWLEKQGTSYTKRDVDNAFVEGMAYAKNELEKQGNSFIKWNKNTKDNKPPFNHSVLMRTKSGVSEGEWRGGNQWLQYRWSSSVKDSDVTGWMELSVLEKQGEQKPIKASYTTIVETGNGGINAVVEKDLSGCYVEQKPYGQMEKCINCQFNYAGYCNGTCILKNNEQKPASEEDMKEALRTEYEKGRADAFAQMQEKWSEEDKKMIGRIRRIIEAYAFSQSAVDVNGDLCEKEYIDADNWLKSLKERYTWKPSDEQMSVLKNAIHIKLYENPSDSLLWGLYEQLKKLKE